MGVADRRGGARPRGAGHARRGQPRGRRCQTDADGRPRRVDRRPARRAPRSPTPKTDAPASMRSSWPRPSPTSGRRARRTGSSSAAAALTLELEPTPDVLAQIARIVRGTDSDGEATLRAVTPRPVPRRVRGRDRLARPGRRQAPAQGRRPARRQRRRRGRLRVRDRHQPRHHPRRPTAAATDLPLLTQARGRRSAPRPRRACAGRP